MEQKPSEKQIDEVIDAHGGWAITMARFVRTVTVFLPVRRVIQSAKA